MYHLQLLPSHLCLEGFWTLKKYVIRSYETSVNLLITRCYIPEDGSIERYYSSISLDVENRTKKIASLESRSVDRDSKFNLSNMQQER
jgi:hypothetical protein